MPNLNGLETARLIRQNYPDTPTVIHTNAVALGRALSGAAVLAEKESQPLFTTPQKYVVNGWQTRASLASHFYAVLIRESKAVT